MELFIKILRWCSLPLLIMLASYIVTSFWNVAFQEIDISFGPLGAYSMLYKQCLSNLTEGCVCTILAALIAPSGKKIVSYIVSILWIGLTVLGIVLVICKFPGHWASYIWPNVMTGVSGSLSSLFGVFLVRKYLL